MKNNMELVESIFSKYEVYKEKSRKKRVKLLAATSVCSTAAIAIVIVAMTTLVMPNKSPLDGNNILADSGVDTELTPINEEQSGSNNQQSAVTASLTETSDVTAEKTQQPIVTQAPVVTEKQPAVTQAPAVTEKQPAVTQAPAVTEKQPVVTQKPAVSEKQPVVTQKPVVTEKPPVVTSPIVTEKPPVVTDKPDMPPDYVPPPLNYFTYYYNSPAQFSEAIENEFDADLLTEITNVEAEGNKGRFQSFIEHIRSSSFFVPMYGEEVMSLQESREITLMASELFELPSVWYYPATTVNSISLTSLHNMSLDSKTTTQVISELNPAFPNINNKAEFSDVYKDIYEVSLSLKDRDVTAICYAFQTDRICIRFLYDDVLVNVLVDSSEIPTEFLQNLYFQFENLLVL